MKNSQRFIISYNKIDNKLRSLYDYKIGQSFADIIRKSVPLNVTVRKYEEVLIDYARLRNVIVHSNVDEKVIAEPNDEATELFEKIARLICTPPTIRYALGHKNIVCLKASESLKSGIECINQFTFSNIPVYDENQLVGVLNNKVIVKTIGKRLESGLSVDELIKHTKLGEIVNFDQIGYRYLIMRESDTLDAVIKAFEENKKLIAVIVTKNGNYLEKPTNLITGIDLVKINKILEDY